MVSQSQICCSSSEWLGEVRLEDKFQALKDAEKSQIMEMRILLLSTGAGVGYDALQLFPNLTAYNERQETCLALLEGYFIGIYY